ncbi:acyl-CoA synthetase (AMP-forming)/AMP-acid ligase II [Clostridium tetanomorphum]|uniref:AMP-binding protein n=1 Tax=Clostridium tetanomorphum TaxID=1553 RepID=A0A923IZU0_CLOTT|nr:AMP-binding protein [Clostridium tetanomorphum]KAJ52004.1 AMP-dependent synthetase and ligase [Clostridium tetanomorphum DSM 665]MBC2397014.1 AMP-binding protein [Clostridium tetanomorphum]MBP1862924.1 acyl-CoA synthetase (AMP-forming)/AMP-acid ligase II [Clostridium tetanomorphum]NRS87061.1 acyl-CoA synthetase (AMP-forming)/AMP-acid ligase II [Clostridium tetanomorphum]NRZ99144.1 acyl-CoA synthetase (AMP-forming)/AMP-acid ligase II [Clostridium tetanomorphum]
MNFSDYIFQFSSHYNKSAVIDKEEYCYKYIYSKVENVANTLNNKGLTRKDSVLLISENSIFFIESYFGIIKSGAICVPINPSLGQEHIKYILNSLKIRHIFIEKKLMKNIENLLNEDIEIYTEEDLKKLGDIFLNTEIESNKSDDVAVILFTSGSTARPKGVMLTHENLISNTNSIIEYLQLSKVDRIEVVLPFYYCYGTSLLHTHIRVGGSLVINNRFMFPETVLDDIDKYQCTGFAGVPSTFQILLKMSNIKNRSMPSLRYITQAGGRMAKIFIKELMNILPHVDIYIMYGQTEATARLSYLPPKMLESKMESIGKGIPGTELKVIDKDGKEVNVGEVGEIVAKGKNIMKGYFNDEEETKRVLKNRYLYTGDLGTVDKDGYIYIVGRGKNIIKSAGNRISPKEIEDVILRINEVIECAVIGIEDDVLGEAVKAFVVLKDKLLNDKYIINYCKNNLPSYKVPKVVTILDELPKNSSGKVIINALKGMD